MNTDALAQTLRLTCAAELLGCLPPGSWPDLAVALLVEDVDDPDIAELAGLGQDVSGWTSDPLTEALYARHAIPAVAIEEAVVALAGLVAADLRVRPAVVTGPMIRMLAYLAPLCDYGSSLANDCYGAEEYLDCDCSGRVDPSFETELQALPGPSIPDTIVRILAAPIRAALPLVQPAHGH